MKQEGYSILNPEQNVYHFVSSGKNGEILKMVYFQPIGEQIYNIVLADFDKLTSTWSDIVRSNNGDIGKIMATVIKIIHYFLKLHPPKLVYLEANTSTKNSLYNRIISNNLSQLMEYFQIMGEVDGIQSGIEVGKSYNSFYIYLKA